MEQSRLEYKRQEGKKWDHFIQAKSMTQGQSWIQTLTLSKSQAV